MKISEVYDFFFAADEIKANGPKLNYWLNRNKARAGLCIKQWDKEREPSQGYKVYLQQVDEIKVRHANKDAKGKPVIIDKDVDGVVSKFYDISDIDNPESPFKMEMQKFIEDHKDVVNEQKKKERIFIEEFVEKEAIEFKPGLVNINDLPPDITKDEMNLIYWMIDAHENE